MVESGPMRGLFEQQSQQDLLLDGCGVGEREGSSWTGVTTGVWPVLLSGGTEWLRRAGLPEEHFVPILSSSMSTIGCQ